MPSFLRVVCHIDYVSPSCKGPIGTKRAFKNLVLLHHAKQVLPNNGIFFPKILQDEQDFFIGNEELLCFYILFVRKNFSQDSFLFSVRSSFYSKTTLNLACLQLNNVFY